MTESNELSAETYARIDDLLRVGSRAVARAQEENRRRGVPNVYSINGILHYELANGELTTRDPYEEAGEAHNPPLQPTGSAGG